MYEKRYIWIYFQYFTRKKNIAVKEIPIFIGEFLTKLEKTVENKDELWQGGVMVLNNKSWMHNAKHAIMKK